ncbi:MAG: fimbrillin family protein, partial [Phocaeicola sp.]
MIKKILLSIAALALVASSCTKHDVIDHNQSGFVDPVLINFSASTDESTGASTDESTGESRAASTTAESFKDFSVYGYQGESTSEIVWSADSPAPLMDNLRVLKTKNEWKASYPTPWPAEGTQVQFFAFSPAASSASGIKYAKDEVTHKPLLTFTAKTNVADQVDLLCSQSAELVAAAEGAHEKVDLTFTHALTKVKFSAKVQPNQALYLSELSLHNLGQEGSFAYTTGDLKTGASKRGAWKKEVTANKGFAIALSDVTKDSITSTEAVDVTATDGATLVIPQAREKVDVSVPKDALFSGNRENSYIKMVYSLKNRADNAWVVGTGSEVAEQVTAYLPVDVDF